MRSRSGTDGRWSALAVGLGEQQPVPADGDRHDGVAVVVPQRRVVAGRGDVVGQDLDLLAERPARGPGRDGGDVAERPDRRVPTVAQRVRVDVHQAPTTPARPLSAIQPERGSAGRRARRRRLRAPGRPARVADGDACAGAHRRDPRLAQHLDAVRRQRALERLVGPRHARAACVRAGPAGRRGRASTPARRQWSHAMNSGLSAVGPQGAGSGGTVKTHASRADSACSAATPAGRCPGRTNVEPAQPVGVGRLQARAWRPSPPPGPGRGRASSS